jgi:hypothetical protein
MKDKTQLNTNETLDALNALEAAEEPEMSVGAMISSLICLCLIPFTWYYATMFGGHVFSDVWNWFMPSLFNLKEITWQHATALSCIGSLFISGTAVFYINNTKDLSAIKKRLGIVEDVISTAGKVWGNYIMTWASCFGIFFIIWISGWLVNHFFFTR